VEECLQRHPDHALTLELLLREAIRLTSLPFVTMPADAVDALERRVLARADEIKAATLRKERPVRRPFWSRLAGKRLRFLPVALSLVIALVVAGVGTVAASDSSLPGKALYPVKLATERVRLAVTLRQEARAQLRLAFAERRLGEMQVLLREDELVGEDLVEALAVETTLALEEIEGMDDVQKAGIATKLLALTERQQAVLVAVRERVPQEAQRGLDRALEVSQRGHERAMMALGVTPEPCAVPSASHTHKPHVTPTHKPTHTPKHTRAPRVTPTCKLESTRVPQAEPTQKFKPTRVPHATPTPRPKPTKPDKDKKDS